MMQKPLVSLLVVVVTLLLTLFSLCFFLPSLSSAVNAHALSGLPSAIAASVHSRADVAIVDSFLVPGSSPRGMAWDGSSLWMVDNIRDVYQLTPSGEVVSSYAITFTAQDMAWDGTHLWIASSSAIHRMDAQGNIVQTLNVNHYVDSGFVWDGTYFWVGDSNSGRIYKHTATGQTLLYFETSDDRPHGITYDGKDLWFANRDFGRSLHRVSIQGETTGSTLETVSLDSLGLPAKKTFEFRVIAWDGTYMWFSADDLFTIYKLDLAQTTPPTPTRTPTSSTDTPPPHTHTPTPTPTPTSTPTSTSTPGTAKTWTMLIYAVADNNLDPWMSDNPRLNGMLYRLRNAGPAAHVQVAVLYDGSKTKDTYLYLLKEDGSYLQFRPDQFLPNEFEARMDEPETLRKFVEWGLKTYESDYYYLALLDHASGVKGLGEDRTTDSDGDAYLTTTEIHSALTDAIAAAKKPIDVLHYDGCSFGLFENAWIADGVADYVVVSPNTGWAIFAYDQYRRHANQSLDPARFAQAVAQTYAKSVRDQGKPYTISVFDMAHFDPMKAAIETLAEALDSYADGATLIDIRNQVQTYDSSGNFVLNQYDAYVDLYDLAERLIQGNPLDDPSVVTAAEAVLAQIATFVIHQADWHASGSFLEIGHRYTYDLTRSHGIAIYYPYSSNYPAGSAYHNYIANKLFFTGVGWAWVTFVGKLPAQSLPEREQESEGEGLIGLLPVTQPIYIPMIRR